MKSLRIAIASLALPVALAAQQSQANPIAAGFKGFEARRARASAGRFLDSTQLREPPDARLLEVLRVRIVGFGFAREARPTAPPSERCTLDVFVDGLQSGSVDDLRARDVAAIEYYEAAFAPVAYRRSGHNCPILLIWLRH